VGKRLPAGYAISRRQLAPIREVRFGPDGQWPDSYGPTARRDVSPAARIASALDIAQAAVWFGVKVIVGVIAALFILIFAAACVAAMFAHGATYPLGR
jgi:hypothetical protein